MSGDIVAHGAIIRKIHAKRPSAARICNGVLFPSHLLCLRDFALIAPLERGWRPVIPEV